MKNSILELLGGTFIFTALTYSTGKGYFNSYFRELSVEPALIDLPIDQIFFEGGRQLVSILSDHLIAISSLLMLYTLARLATSHAIIKWASATHAPAIKSSILSIKNVFLIIFFLWFSNYSFNSAIASGKYTSSKARCIPATAHTTDSKSAVSGCLVHKTIDNIWIKHESNGETTVSIFPRDNFYRIDTPPRR